MYYREETNNKVKKRLLLKWQEENKNDPLENVDVVVLNTLTYHTVDNGKTIGWVGLANTRGLNTLLFVFVNKEYRGKGYLRKVIADAKQHFNLQALVIGLISDTFNEYSKIYADCGFPYFHRTFFIEYDRITQGSQLFLTDTKLALVPYGNMFMLSPEEIRKLDPNGTGMTLEGVIKLKKEAQND
jgi:GNAT superfamily N-acetyltransferase